jgi:type IV secretion system protein VirB10
MSETSTSAKTESDPKYIRQMRLFGVLSVIMLCIALVFSTFVGNRKKQQEPEALSQHMQDTQDAAPQNVSVKIEENIAKERRRRQLSFDASESADYHTVNESRGGYGSDLGTGANSNGYNEYGRTDTRGSRDVQGNVDRTGEGNENSEGLSVEEEFYIEEKKRALMARRSPFGLKRIGTGKQDNSGGLPSFGGMPPLDNTDDQSVIDSEKKRVDAEIARVEKTLADPNLLAKLKKGNNSFKLNPALNPTSSQLVNTPEVQVEAPQNPVTTIGQPVSESEPKDGQVLIATGTVVSGVLDQELMSDYTGPFRGLVTHDVYDVSGNYVVIPKSSRIIGRSVRISNVNEPIQSRMGMAVKWIVLPDGKRISFEKRSAALDQAGVPAVKDQANRHLLAQFLGVTAYAMVSTETSYEGSGAESDDTFEGNFGSSLRKQSGSLAEKYLKLVPTITLRIGTPIKVFLEDDVYVYPWEDIGKKIYRANRPVYWPD